ncbi:hypothetical protein GCM10012283_23780 [Phycicoccus endophyticus]|nr:hypothetical protein GCM10012283_23780 [Phycicoccus endophyticus]
MLRLLRAAVATLSVLGISAAAHQVGGGEAPGAVAMGVLALLVGPPTWLATGRRLTAPALFALLAAAQGAVHVGLATMMPGHGSAAHVHVHGALPGGLATGASAPEHVMPMTQLDPPMLLAHVVATLVLALLLARAEDALWRVVSALLPRITSPARVPGLPRLTVPATAPARATRPVRPLGGRAPPLAFA